MSADFEAVFSRIADLAMERKGLRRPPSPQPKPRPCKCGVLLTAPHFTNWVCRTCYNAARRDAYQRRKEATSADRRAG